MKPCATWRHSSNQSHFNIDSLCTRSDIAHLRLAWVLPDILSNILYGYMDPKMSSPKWPRKPPTQRSVSKKFWEGHRDIRTSRHAPCVRVYQCIMDLADICALLAMTLWTPVPPGLMEKQPAIDMVLPLKLQSYTHIHMTMTRGDELVIVCPKYGCWEYIVISNRLYIYLCIVWAFWYIAADQLDCTILYNFHMLRGPLWGSKKI